MWLARLSQSKPMHSVFLSTKETDILRGEWVDPSAGKIAFADFASQWLTNQSHLRPRTVELYHYLLASH